MTFEDTRVAFGLSNQESRELWTAMCFRVPHHVFRPDFTVRVDTDIFIKMSIEFHGAPNQVLHRFVNEFNNKSLRAPV